MTQDEIDCYLSDHYMSEEYAIEREIAQEEADAASLLAHESYLDSLVCGSY